MRRNILTGATLDSEVARDHRDKLDIDVGALFPGSPLAIDATDLSFCIRGVRSKTRYGTAYDPNDVRYDFGMSRLEAELRDKHARHDCRLFESDIIGAVSRPALVDGLIDFGDGASIHAPPNPAAKTVDSVG